MKVARRAGYRIELGLMVAGFAATSVGCFPDAPGTTNDTTDGLDTSEDTGAIDTAVVDTATNDSNGGDTAPDAVDTAETGDTAMGDTRDTVAGDDADDGEVVAQGCELDGECARLTAAPCVVGRCVDRVCQAVNISVACDDGDPCTTADKCAAGTCKGRAFNAAEAKNWFLQIGGDGEDAAFGVAAHPSGDALVVGGFHGTVSVGGIERISGGDVDAFFLRVTPSGIVTRFDRFGGAQRDVGTFVVVDGTTGDTAVAWSTLDVESQLTPKPVTSTIAWLRENGTILDSIEVPALILGLDGMKAERVVGVFEFQGSVELPRRDGSFISMSSSSPALALFQASRSGFLWARPLTSASRLTLVVLRRGPAALRAVVSVNGSAQLGNQTLGPGPHTIDLDDNGDFLASFEAALWSEGDERSALVESALSGPPSGGLGGLGLCGATIKKYPRLGVQGCEVQYPCDLGFPTPVGAFGIGFADHVGGMVVRGTEVGQFEFGPGIVGPLVETPLLVAYDRDCRARGLWTDSLLGRESASSALRFARTDVADTMGSLAVGAGGHIFVADDVVSSGALGPEFGGQVVVVRGASDALIGAISPANYFGCDVPR